MAVGNVHLYLDSWISGLIMVTHGARYEGEPRAHNLRQLVRGHLRGRARVHLAGDLHFYMRYGAARPAASRRLRCAL
jgi:hypothetical protein